MVVCFEKTASGLLVFPYDEVKEYSQIASLTVHTWVLITLLQLERSSLVSYKSCRIAAWTSAQHVRKNESDEDLCKARLFGMYCLW